MSHPSNTAAFRERLLDVLAVAVIIAVVLPLYLATMYPDMAGGGDSHKFQYLGRVLGTAHPPGYPFYVLVSHLFSYLPIGTLAWRMNLLSVVAALLTVLCSWAAARRLGANRILAVLIAVATATGFVFWNQSLIAEVYSLGALMLMIAIWRILAWRDSKRDADLLMAVGALSLGLGNHLTIAVVAPAFVAFVLLTDARRAVRGRLLLAAAIIIAIGIGQYGFIMLRTWQRAPHLEATAHTIGELATVVAASKYGDSIFAFGVHDFVTKRVPLMGRQILEEAHIGGVLLILAGLVAGVLRAPRETLLLAGSAASILFLTANVDADTAGFAVAALPLLWLLIALVATPRPRPWRGERAMLIGTTAVLAVVVAFGARRNFTRADHSDRTVERRFWTAVLRAIPDRTIVITEAYGHDQSLRYLLVGEDVGARRGIELGPRDVNWLDTKARIEGRTVIGFEEAVADLRRSGFEFEPLEMFDWPIGQLAPSSRRNRFVLVGMQREAMPLVAAEDAGLIRQFGGTWDPSSSAQRYATVGVPSGGSGAPEASGDIVDLHVPAGTRVGPGAVLPVPVTIRVNTSGIEIQSGTDEPFHTPAPLVVVILDSRGQVRSRLIPGDRWSLRPKMDGAFRMTASSTCADIGDRQWHDVSPASDREVLLRVNNYRPYDASAVLYVASDQPLAPRLTEAASPAPPRVTIEPVSMASRQSRLDADGLNAPALRIAAHLTRIAVQVNDGGDEATLRFAMGAQPISLWARGDVDRIAAPRARLCRRTVLR